MGGRSIKSSGSSSLPKATEAGAMGMYNDLLGGQLGVIGDAFGGMLQQGMQWMDDNPGKANFMKAVGGMPIQLDRPDFMQEFIKKYGTQEPASLEAPTPYNVNDDMRARLGMGSPMGQYGQYGVPTRAGMFGGK